MVDVVLLHVSGTPAGFLYIWALSPSERALVFSWISVGQSQQYT